MDSSFGLMQTAESAHKSVFGSLFNDSNKVAMDRGRLKGSYVWEDRHDFPGQLVPASAVRWPCEYRIDGLYTDFSFVSCFRYLESIRQFINVLTGY
jgi:hypothetical protein